MRLRSGAWMPHRAAGIWQMHPAHVSKEALGSLLGQGHEVSGNVTLCGSLCQPVQYGPVCIAKIGAHLPWQSSSGDQGELFVHAQARCSKRLGVRAERPNWLHGTRPDLFNEQLIDSYVSS